MKPLLAVTMGDPAGVGPEIVIKAMSNKVIFERAQPFIIGSVHTLKIAMQQTGIDLPVRAINSVADVEESDQLQVLELDDLDCQNIKQGQVSAQAGHAAVQFFESAVTLALAGKIQGVVTCPINKEAVHAAGYHGDIGHQEILGRMTQSGLTATMLMTTGLKVAHLSTHKSLAEAVRFVRKDVLIERITLTANCLRQWTGREPKIAVAALNPHGGEGGLLGREELDEIAPAVDQLQQRGLDVVGPYPADSVFYRAAAGEFDAVMALYHDQGHIAIKMHNFADSITATMGIPFIRTSVDHGTAFDIAGKNLANADGLGRAVDAAISMANQSL